MAEKKKAPALPKFEPQKRSIVVASRYVAMMQTFVSTEETRYYLTGIYIEPHPVEGVIMVATDGHRMAVIHDKEGLFKGEGGWICPVPEDVFKLCRKKPRKNDNDRSPAKVHFIGNSISVTDSRFADKKDPLDLSGGFGFGVMTVSRADPIDGTYPEWRRILPKKKPETESHNLLAFNPDYLIDFKHVIKAAGLSDMTPAVMFPSPKGTASIVRFEGLPEFFGLLMGCHADPAMVAIPAWVQAERTKVAGKKKVKKKP